ncbi:MAG: glycosyltransferase family 2 protein [Clostridia bacterium]|nr:glycosyltransferase family 2 protein [Clostridia bacterium]
MGSLISVIIPVYNVEVYLEEALQSVRDQTYGNLEIIIIDDGSTDGSGGICERSAAEDPRFRVICQENRGLSAARNRGLDVSTGEYIAFLDPDDAYLPSFMEKMLTAMERDGTDICECRYALCRTEEHMTTPKEKRRVEKLPEGT